MTEVSLGAALVCGIVSFLSLCVLPPVPGYLAYVAGGLLLVGIGGFVFTGDMTRLARQLAFLQPVVL